MRIFPPPEPPSLEKSNSERLRVDVLSIRFLTLFLMAFGNDSMKSEAVVSTYQVPSGSILENSRMCSRYLRAQLTAQSRPCASDNPFARAASTMEAASRLRSHSHG